MSLEIVQNLADFETLREEWDALTSEPMRSFDWHFAWWSSFCQDADLHLYTYRQAGKLIGVAPFFADAWLGQKRLRYIASGRACSDYADVISSPEHRDRFVKAIADELRQQSDIQLIELEGILAESQTQSLDAELCQNSHWSYESELDPTWVLELPNSWEAFMRSTRKSLRRKIKNAEKRLRNGEITVRSTSDDLDFDEAFDTLVQLHQDRFIGKGEPGLFADDRFKQFLYDASARLALKKSAEILIAYHDGRSIVSQLYFHAAEGPQLYQSGVRSAAMRLEPGHMLFTYAVKRAIASGEKVFDFLRGSEPYKTYWGACPRALTSRRCVPKKIVPSMINQSYCWLRTAKRMTSGCSLSNAWS